MRMERTCLSRAIRGCSVAAGFPLGSPSPLARRMTRTLSSLRSIKLEIDQEGKLSKEEERLNLSFSPMEGAGIPSLRGNPWSFSRRSRFLLKLG